MVPNQMGHVMRRMTGFDTHLPLAWPRAKAPVPFRMLTLGQARRLARQVSSPQDGLLSEALDCVERGLYRAAHVTAWQAFMALTSEVLMTDRSSAVSRLRPELAGCSTAGEI